MFKETYEAKNKYGNCAGENNSKNRFKENIFLQSVRYFGRQQHVDQSDRDQNDNGGSVGI